MRTKFILWTGATVVAVAGVVAGAVTGMAVAEVRSEIEYDASLTIEGTLSLRDGFDIQYGDTAGSVGQPYQLDVAIRAPRKAKEIEVFNDHSPGSAHSLNISCVPFASFATIQEIEFVSIENLPKGIFATTNAKGLKAAGGDVVALRFSGRPTTPGTYSLIFNLKARASVMGVSGPMSFCEVTGAIVLID